MDTPTREEIDLKLENLELKMDGRLAAIESGIGDLKAASQNAAAQFSSLKNTLIITAISSVLAVAGLNYALTSNMLAAFDSGKAIGRDQAEVKKQTEEMAALLKAMREQLDTSKVAAKGAK
jgi:hypothetical protein